MTTILLVSIVQASPECANLMSRLAQYHNELRQVSKQNDQQLSQRREDQKKHLGLQWPGVEVSPFYQKQLRAQEANAAVTQAKKLKEQLGIAHSTEHDFGTFLKSRLSSDEPKLKPEEIEFLADDPLARFIFINGLRLSENGQFWSNALKRMFGPAIDTGKAWEKSAPHALKAPKEFKNAYGEIINQNSSVEALKLSISPLIESSTAILKLLSPLPKILRSPFKKSQIALKQWHNPKLKLSDLSLDEKMFLMSHNLVEAFDQRGEFLRTHPKVYQLRKTYEITQIAATNLAYIAAAGFAINSVHNEATLESLVTDEKYKTSDSEIQIINETVPLPHLAIRIGDRVYSYGQEFMTANNVIDYFESNYQNGANSDLLAPATQVVTYSLSRPEVERLTKFLEAQHGKRYENVTGVNDCASMCVAALKANTSLDDEILNAFHFSPSIAILKLMANPKCKNAFTLNFSANKKHDDLRLARNAWINFVETKLFLNPALLATSHLQNLKLHEEKGERIAYLLPEQEEFLKKFETSTKEEFFSDGLGRYLQDIEASDDSDKYKKISVWLNEYQTRYTAERDSPAASLLRKHELNALLEVIQDYQARIEKPPVTN